MLEQPEGRSRHKQRVPPGPPPRRRGVLRNLKYYAGFMRDPIAFVGDRFARYGDIYFAPGPDGGLFAVKHPDHVREVLMTRASKFGKKHTAFERLSTVLGSGLLTAEGEQWKRHRRMIQPAFHPRRLDGYARVMAEEASRAAGGWRDGETVDVSDAMMELTLRVVCRTLFGHDPGGEKDEVAQAMVGFHSSLGGPQDLFPDWFPVPGRSRTRRASEALDRIVMRMVEARRGEIEAGAERRDDLLQWLLEAVDEEGDGGRLGEREVRDELLTLFLAGHETTSHALTWTFYLLSQNPLAERALHEELERVLGGRPAEYGDVSSLPYTEQVVKEAMRLYPPAYMVARRAVEDTEIGGYPVPAGSEVVVWLYMTHRDPRFFPEPTRFRPERFEPDEEAALPKCAYLPFGAGPRACIGRQFALIETVVVLATLAQRVRFRLAPGHRVEPRLRITMFPRHGMKMVAGKR